MTRNELVEAIDFGSDILFDCGNKSYCILGWNDSGPLIAEQKTGNGGMIFKDGADLVENYKINGIALSKQIDRIHITYQT